MKKHYMIAALALGVAASAFALAGCNDKPPQEVVPKITEAVRYSESTNPYSELTWQEYKTIDDWTEKSKTAPIYYQFEGSYSEAYQGNYSRTFLYMNCYKDGSLHATYGTENYWGYWTNVDKRGKENLVLHIVRYNDKEYNDGMYDSVCEKTADDGYYEYASTIIWNQWGTRTVLINGLHYSPVTSLSVSEGKTEYLLNDKFSSTGLSISVTRENGRSAKLDEQSLPQADSRVKFSEFDASTEGEKEITVTYINSEVSSSYKVNVNGVSSISVDTADAVTSYHVGDKHSAAGLVVNAMCTNGKTVKADIGRCTFTGYDEKKAEGEYEVTVTYDKTFTAKYPVKVYAIKSLALDVGADAQLQYYVGDKINSKGLDVKATFNDDVTDNIEISRCKITFENASAAAPAAADSSPVTVEFQGLKKTFNVKIIAPEFNGSGKFGGTAKDMKIKVVSPTQCELTCGTEVLTLNYKTMSVGGKTIYILSKPTGSAITDAVMDGLHKQYILDMADFSLAMTMVYEIPSSDAGGIRAAQEPCPPGPGGNSEQRFVTFDEAKGEATLTYKYWYASTTDTWVLKYTKSGNIITFTELVSLAGNAWGGASFAKLHKTWELKADGTMVKYTPPAA